MGKVFISHKNSDQGIAKQVAERVRRNGLDCYLDSVDPALAKDGPGLADYLLRQMSGCQQLIAVVSSETAKSWWVPWEIGVGSEKRFRMATFARTLIVLPSYLEKWPRLQTQEDVDLYCEYSKRSDRSIHAARARVLTETARMSAEGSGARSFHRDLRTALARSR